MRPSDFRSVSLCAVALRKRPGPQFAHGHWVQNGIGKQTMTPHMESQSEKSTDPKLRLVKKRVE